MTVYNQVVIVGVGLLGGSIGKALRERRLANSVVGVGRNPSTLSGAIECGAVDRTEQKVSVACRDADVLIICTPVQTIARYVNECLQHVAPGTLITDAGSTKLGICREVETAAHQSFCGSHPLAGSDKSGVRWSDGGLFNGRLTIVTPTSTTPPELVERTKLFWESLGSRTRLMSPDLHDRALASTSHVPHLLASVLAASTPDEYLSVVASGWCDTTRVAGGDPELWCQIIEENYVEVTAAFQRLGQNVQTMLQALRNRDREQLKQLLEQGKVKRDSVGN
ncbi:MAG: prephenate dehydrogenase/arogenate dehydrogenase family protein [Planctomycetales bacterium]|nr:prephenate dehydrogenase/arogenate dehydrogenase family protein [Planctomycetales bacterium]